MEPLSIVVALDVSEQVVSGLIPGRPSSLVDDSDLEGVEEALHRGVVLAAAGAAHGGYRLDIGELPAVSLRCVLAAAIRVTDEPGRRPLPLGGHHQSSRRQFSPHVVAHCVYQH